MSFLANIAPLLSPAFAIGSAIFGKPKMPNIKIPEFPKPKEPLKGPVRPSDTASAAKARIAERARAGRGIGGLVLSRIGGTSSAQPSRQTLLGS